MMKLLYSRAGKTKNPDDERWQYQINLIKSGQQMEPIPLIKMPDGNYIGNGDGSNVIL